MGKSAYIGIGIILLVVFGAMTYKNRKKDGFWYGFWAMFFLAWGAGVLTRSAKN